MPAARPRPAGARRRGADADDDSEVVVAGLVGSGGGGLTPLTFAAREGDIESARKLLDAGANVNQATEYGWTPLLTAVNNRNYQLAKLLLERGANPNLANKGGWTPLYLATDNRNIEGGDYPVPKPDMDHLDLIKLLLEKGADPNARVKDNTLTRTIFTMQWFYENGATPFIRAAQSSDTALMKLLLKHGADPKAVTANGDNALTASAGIGWVDGVTYERSPEENLEAVRMLLDLGLDPNRANKEGRTPLMGAALKGRPEVIQLLVDRGAKLDTRDRGSRDTHIPGRDDRRRDVAGARLRRGAGARRRAVGRRAARGVGADPQADGRARDAGAAPGRTINSICVVALLSGAAAVEPRMRGQSNVARSPFPRCRRGRRARLDGPAVGRLARSEAAPQAGPAPAAAAGPARSQGHRRHLLRHLSQRAAEDRRAGARRPSLADVAAHADVWEKVIRKVRAGMMPPAGVPRPPAEARTALVSSPRDALDAPRGCRRIPGVRWRTG